MPGASQNATLTDAHASSGLWQSGEPCTAPTGCAQRQMLPQRRDPLTECLYRLWIGTPGPPSQEPMFAERAILVNNRPGESSLFSSDRIGRLPGEQQLPSGLDQRGLLLDPNATSPQLGLPAMTATAFEVRRVFRPIRRPSATPQPVSRLTTTRKARENGCFRRVQRTAGRS